VAIVLGTEGSGLSDEAAIRVSRQVRIPIAPNVDSLNVATAAGIALYSVSRAIASSSNPAETRP
jgi:tRNA G18 (ribose-2'-O)-methylase SpoU